MAQTPSTEDLYLGDGVETTFGITFPYLKQDEVFVAVDGVNTPYTWLAGSTASVQLSAAPAPGTVVRVYRSTRAFIPLHTFAGGVPFLPRFVDENNRQLLYAMQEAVNSTAGTAAEALAVAENAEAIAQQNLIEMQEQYDEFTQGIAVYRGLYAAGVVLRELDEYVKVDAATTGTTAGLYRPNASATLPLTLTGIWAVDSTSLVLLGEEALRQELTSPGPGNGPGMLPFDEVTPYVDGSVGAELIRQKAVDNSLAADIASLGLRRTAFSMPVTAIDGSTTPGAAYKSEPRLVETNSGKIIVFYRVGNSHVENTGHLVYKYFDKQLRTWSQAYVLDDDALYDTRNHLVGCDAATGRVFCFYNVREIPDNTNRRTYLKYSDDDGLTWSERRDFSQYCPYPSQVNIPFGKLISFAGGKLLLTVYNYLTIFTLSSSDGGLTWGTTSASEPNPNPNITTLYSGLAAAGNDNITEPTVVAVDALNLVCVARCVPTGTEVNGTATVQYLSTTWEAATRYLTGEYCYNAGRLYYASTGGTSGSSAPTHTSGSATDGTVTWTVAGTPTVWSASTAVVAEQTLLAAGTRVYRVKIAGTTGAAAPSATKLAGNETQLAYFRSTDGGNTWSAPTKVTWTSATKNVATSPPCVIMADQDTVEIAWFARFPEFALYRVRMAARAFHANPAWAFSKADGEPRHRIARALPAPTNSPDYNIDFGYVDLLQPTFSLGVMAAWYDAPTLASTRADIYCSMINV